VRVVRDVRDGTTSSGVSIVTLPGRAASDAVGFRAAAAAAAARP